MALKTTIQPSEPLGVSRRAPAGVAFVALAAVLLVVGAACGGSSNKPAAAAATTTTTAAGGGRFGAAFTAFSTCMSQHGVKLPTRRPGNGPRPTGGSGAGGGRGGFGGGGFGGGGFGSTPSSLPPGVTASQYQAALSACRSKLPTGGFGGGRGGAATAAYRSCMSDHGIKLPGFGGFGSTSSTTASSTPPTTINRNDPKYIAANKVCMALLPARGGTTTTTAG